jgi:hypothetical protein
MGSAMATVAVSVVTTCVSGNVADDELLDAVERGDVHRAFA